MMESSNAWDRQDPTLSVPSQDDFQQFLDIGMNDLSDSLQFDFPDYNHQHATQSQLMHQNGDEAMHTGMENGGSTGHDTTMQEHMPSMTTATSYATIQGGANSQAHSSNESLVELDAQIQYLQHQRHQQQQRQLHEQQQNYYTQNPMIPPTPSSMDLHGANAHFYPQSDPQHQAMYDRYQMQAKQQDMAFTPLVSPAVTPLESHFNIPEYTVPGAYFSPLSSPALHAQNEHSAIYDARNSGTTNSPIDMNPETHSAPASSVILSRKASKQAPQKPRSVRTVRQSPIVKPRKSKKSGTSIPAQALGDIIEPTNPQITRSNAASLSYSNPSTEESEDSISPEHLSDMAPPPVPPPGSAGRSPYITSQKENPSLQHLALGSPATPASLMRLTQSPQANGAGNNQNMDIDQGMEVFALPEPATSSKPKPSPIDTQSDGQITPTLASSGVQAPGFQPLPSPAFNRSRTSVSASQSPQIDSMNGRKSAQTSARGSKKRAGSSVLASPALLPRISPSMKPLIPGTPNLSESTASLLLASKSNYQKILEGTHLPGVSYPSELSTNLTSKRTSHKIAEQGRRNRINFALQEIATLLPRDTKDSSGEKSGSGDAGEPNDPGGSGKGAAQSANSKASTVEQAIEYIKQLKQEVADANKRAEEAEKQLGVKS
ncbi:Phosphorus acquisition-controlling protein [Lachnellula hyalina]|uniref:Phosphorus acquisition-controlling protein n=1 Tax=Lachnellula hyalina TaxID=1316788 RepID=A0A8H8QXV8_9HELO|nr:Phosphorus acquisition-controlling protein [Lachnellula hyalina]TVY24868.1 Phosphorus acquisition-controlling protein [Lachnellula hyalina]